MSILITEKKMRQIVREMLQEAETFTTPEPIKLSQKSSYNPVFDVHRSAKSGGKVTADMLKKPEVAAAVERMKQRVPAMKKMLFPITQGKKLITPANATPEESLTMSTYLQWYALSRGVQDQKPWSEDLYPGTTWPAASLTQFQTEQGLLADGKLGKQTATFIFSAGSILTSVPGMSLSQSSVQMNLKDQLDQIGAVGSDQPAKDAPSTYRLNAGEYTTPASRSRAFTQKQQSLLGKQKVGSGPVKPSVVDVSDSPASKSIAIDDKRDEILEMFDDAAQNSDDLLPREIAAYRKSIEMFMDVDADEIAMKMVSGKLPLGIRNAVARALAARGVPTEVINLDLGAVAGRPVSLAAKLEYFVNLHV